KAMSEVLEVDDSVITFNWDLLADQELLHKPQYTNFSVLCLNRMIGRGTPVISGTPGRQGLFLKLHGSLSWYICSNAKCPGGSEIDLDLDAQVSLTRYLGMGLSRCQRCGADTTPVIVPPVLHKRVTDISLIKSTWGLALQR